LKRKVRDEFGKIPEVMFQKSIMNMNKRGGPHGWGRRPAFWGEGGKLWRKKAMKYVIH
jgi:hypothetical protein